MVNRLDVDGAQPKRVKHELEGVRQAVTSNTCSLQLSSYTIF